jgi:flagellar motility protein MotE (MotC chaperone)
MKALKTFHSLCWIVLFSFAVASFAESAEVTEESVRQSTAEGLPDKTLTPDAKILKSVSIERASLERIRGDLLLEQDRLRQIRKELEQRLQELDQARKDLIREQERLKVVREKEMNHLVTVYESMDSEQAAPLVETMNMGVAVELLSRMKGKKAGRILEFVGEKRAVQISEQLAQRNMFMKR